jgi:Ca2+-binding RTX toxin-like protein
MSAGITDFSILNSSGGLTLYSATGPDGGLAAYRIGTNGTVSALNQLPFGAGSLLPTTTRLMKVDLDGGAEGLVALGRQGPTVSAVQLASDGVLGPARVDLTPDLGLTETPGLGVQLGGHVALAEADGAILRSFGRDGAGLLVQQDAVDVMAQTGLNRDGGITAVTGVTVGTDDYLLVGVAGADVVMSYGLGADGRLQLADQIGLTSGLGIADPTAIETVQMDGISYALIASAGSSSLTVARIGTDGGLTPVDQVLDSLATRFGGATSLSVTEAGGHVYVLAGGADDGLSLFALTPGGRLAHLGSVEDTATRALATVQAVDLAASGGVLNLFAASTTEPGIAHLTLATDELGSVIRGAPGAVTVSGGSGADILIAGDGANSLRGNAGADLFVFRPEAALVSGQLGTVLDYQQGVDRLDLSTLPLFHGVAQLSVAQQSWGARLSYGDWWIDVRSSTGGALTEADFNDAAVADLDRVYLGNASDETVVLSDATVSGGSGDGSTPTTGTEGADVLTGGDGGTALTGLGGNDLLRGGVGIDTLDGGLGNDTLEGGAGADWLIGGDGLSDVASYYGATSGVRVNLSAPDTNTGDAAGDSYSGIEVVLGSPHADDLRGTADANTLVGREGDDFLMGLGGRDMLRGDAGNDTMDGGYGSDTLRGGDGHDVLYGGQGNDRILGEAGNDRIVATLGNNKLFAGAGADTVMDGPGASRLIGNAGSDFLVGGAGNDTIVGNSAHDRLAGGDGRDKIVGGTGNDYMVGNAGDDWFVFNPGYGSDTIGDFSVAEGDQFYVNIGLGAADAGAVLALAQDTAQGLDFVFADGTEVLLAGLHDFTGLEAQIVIFG